MFIASNFQLSNLTDMYKLKPLYEPNVHVEVPECMYKLKNINGDNLKNNIGAGNVEQLIKLEDRQEAILRRLEELRSQVTKLSQATTSSSTHEDNNTLKDLVISASPANPPVSLLVLQQFLAKQYKLLTSCHCHSSVRDVPVKLKNVFDGKIDTINRGQYEIAFTLTWKDVKHGPTLMVSPKSQVLLEGETTIARYLARLLKPSYEDCDIVMATQIDQWVDTSAQFIKGNNKEKNAILKNLNSKLGKADWLAGNEMSLADIMMWAVVVGSDVAPNVKAWVDKITALPEFRTVVDKLC